jgi:hypothetical protein
MAGSQIGRLWKRGLLEQFAGWLAKCVDINETFYRYQGPRTKRTPTAIAINEQPTQMGRAQRISEKAVTQRQLLLSEVSKSEKPLLTSGMQRSNDRCSFSLSEI